MPEPIEHITDVLACDVGNARVHLARVRGDRVSGQQALPLDGLSGLSEALKALWRDMGEGRKVVACSVNPDGLKALEAAAADALDQQVLVVGRDLPLPIETNLPHPADIGTDRLCAAVAAYDHLGAACVVADFGSAVTIDCVDAEGVFQGGAILPGLQMGAESLAARTSRLPHVKLTQPRRVFGKDTTEAIVGGLISGARGALRELVEAYATKLGQWPVVVLTGGDARLVCEDPNESDLVQAVVDDLVCRGVAIAYYRTLLK